MTTKPKARKFRIRRSEPTGGTGAGTPPAPSSSAAAPAHPSATGPRMPGPVKSE